MWRWLGGVSVLLVCAQPAFAAPLDVFLSANPEPVGQTMSLELATDQMNGRLDVFNFRSSSSDPDNASGDYNGNHVRAGVRVGERGWLSGSLWQRAVGDATDTFRYTSWQVSGQYRLSDAQDWMPDLGLRLSAWGNYAAQTETTKPVVVPGAKLDSVKITNPADQQLQADLVGTWKLSAGTDVSALLSLGTSQLSYGGMSATTTLDGCHYNLAFTGNAIYGTLASPCNAGIYVQEIYDNSGRLGIDVANEIAWRGTFFQAGVNTQWQNGPWTVRAGYLFYLVRREAVDAILASRNKASFTQNHNLSLEGSYRIQPHVQLLARGQFSSNLFFNDMPVTYNTSTASRFDGKYSLLTLGLLMDF